MKKILNQFCFFVVFLWASLAFNLMEAQALENNLESVKKGADELYEFSSTCAAFYTVKSLMDDKDKTKTNSEKAQKSLQYRTDSLALAKAFAALNGHTEKYVDDQVEAKLMHMYNSFKDPDEANRKEFFRRLVRISKLCNDFSANQTQVIRNIFKKNGVPEDVILKNF